MKNILTLLLVFVSILGLAQSPTVKDIKVVDNVRFITNGDTLFSVKTYEDSLLINDNSYYFNGVVNPFAYGDSIPSAVLYGGNSINSGKGALALGTQDTITSTGAYSFTGGFGNYSRNTYDVLLGYVNRANIAAGTVSSILIGKSNTRSNLGTATSIAIGQSNTVGGGAYPAISIGNSNSIANQGIGIGGALTCADLSINLGFNNTTVANGISIGYNQGTNGIDAIVLGYSSNGRQNSVSLGAGITHMAGSYSNHIGTTISNSASYANLFGRSITNTAIGANVFGFAMTNSGTYSTVLGYQTKNVTHNSIVLGYDSVSSENNLVINTILRGYINDTATVNLTNAGGKGVTIPTNYICMFNIDVVGVDTSDVSRSFSTNISGRMANNNGTLTLTASNKTEQGASSCFSSVDIIADNTNKKLQVTVTNEAGKYFRYVANLRLTFLKIK